MQQDIIKLLKNSNFAFVREIIGELLVWLGVLSDAY